MISLRHQTLSNPVPSWQEDYEDLILSAPTDNPCLAQGTTGPGKIATLKLKTQGQVMVFDAARHSFCLDSITTDKLTYD